MVFFYYLYYHVFGNYYLCNSIGSFKFRCLGSIITDKTDWGEDIKTCLGQGATYKDIVYYYLE